MTSQDDLALLKQMYQRGEISDEQYDVLRRHVLWGTPLPQLMDEVPGPRRETPPAAAVAPPAPRADPDVPTFAADRYRSPAQGSRQARREAAEAADPPGHPPSGSYPPPTGPPPTGPAEGHGPPFGGSSRPVGPVSGYGLPPGSPPGDGYGEPRSRRARREAEEAADYSPAAYLPPAASRTPPAEALRSRRERPEEQDRSVPEDAPRSRRERREAAERSALPAEPYRPIAPGDYSPSAYLPPAGLPGTAPPPDYSLPNGTGRLREDRWSGSGSSVETGPRPAGEPADLPAYPPDELQPRRARREVDGPRPDEPRRGQRGGSEAGATRVADQPVKARRRRSVVAVLTSVVLALALAAGGVWWFTLRQAGVLPADYAKSVCGSVRDWQQSVDSSNSTLVTTIAREQDRTAVRTAVSAYYTTVAGRTDQLRATILDAGVPDVDGGQAYSDSFAAAVGTEATDLRGLSAKAGRLDPAAAATFQIELQSLLTGSETAVGTVSSALARPSAGTPTALRAALSAEPSCAPYVG